MARPAPSSERRALLVGAFGLVVAIGLAYAGVLDHDFVGFDDDDYVSENPVVLRGLTADGVVWAFTTGHAANWHPVTWLSHMLDVSLFGVEPGAMAAVNVALHAAVCALLAFYLFRVSGSVWGALAAAALFGLHPLRVESVAWIAERKDLLCAFFFLATLEVWRRWLERPTPGRYAGALLLHAMALAAKPVAVTLPCVLLLLDVWPRRRRAVGTSDAEARPEVPIARLLLEKLPFFALTLLSIAVTFAVQSEGGAVRDGLFASPAARIANGVVAYASYLANTLWPVDLACFYPWSRAIREADGFFAAFAQARVLVSLGALVAATGVVALAGRRRPWLIVGWLWFGGTMVPMLGLVQVGNQAMADRYTYVPTMGLALMLCMAIASLPRAAWRRGAAAASLALAVVLGALTQQQAATWRDGETLFRHALDATDDNYLAHFNLGTLLLRGAPPRVAEAREHLEAAYALEPEHGGIRLNLGAVDWLEGRADRATGHFEAAVRLRPDDPEAHLSLGSARYEQGRVEDALAHFERVVALAPDDVRGYANLATVLLWTGRAAEAERAFERALTIAPDEVSLREGLAAARAARAP